MDLARAGDHAVLVQLDPTIAAAELHARAAAVRALDGVLACIVGHSSLYVVFEYGVRRLAAALEESGSKLPHSKQHQVPVSFDGENFDEFLTHTKQTRDTFLRRVREIRLIVRYLGFRGGFAYLDGWPQEWAMPRRPTSRPVRRGSFAVAGNVAGFYPIDSPGGWNILAHTNEDLEYRFAPGDEIVLDVAQALLPVPKVQTRASAPQTISAPFMTRIEPPNWSNLDRGMPVGGPFDPDLASALEGDVYEFAQIGPRITKARTYVWADLNGVREVHGPIDIGRIQTGLRGYLANNKTEDRGPRTEDRLTIRAMKGPHDIGIDTLECIVTPKLDRIGIRLKPGIKLDAPADMPSCGMQFGTLQLHPDGSIVAMGPEHPVTGGYLQPLTVLWSERWKLAHLAPGQRVRFVAT